MYYKQKCKVVSLNLAHPVDLYDLMSIGEITGTSSLLFTALLVERVENLTKCSNFYALPVFKVPLKVTINVAKGVS